MIRTLDAGALGVDAIVAALERPPSQVPPEVSTAVDAILAGVRARGDAAVVAYTAKFDGFAVTSAAELAISTDEMDGALQALEPAARAALDYAAERIERYHAAAMPKSWRLTDEHGSSLGQEIRPLERVGLYIPGGRAAYPSTVLMTAVPARVAGVREIVLVTPPAADGRVNPVVLAAARVAGVTEGWRIGGAQAIAALAYGTATIRRVDKIVGPGNVYVALAKTRVFGEVGIDMMAGPSEVVVVADASADADWIAADLLAQAEHDPMARAVLITDCPALVPRVESALATRLAGLPRREIAAAALRDHGALILAGDLERAVEIANRLAPEHLELMVAVPAALLPRVRHAGAIFLGGHTPEVVGDYVAGPNHVLPTAGTARFASPLGADDFVKRSSVIEYSPSGLAAALSHLTTLSRIEGLTAHGSAAEARMERPPATPPRGSGKAEGDKR
ncbi:MAG TPA: histidinol dehydrogenase [Methylomirabilota bacterium]|jgi:histidinol dehydrogenase|nr:histidinol dehydrogenase [Methylomirabilota bacterium]